MLEEAIFFDTMASRGSGSRCITSLTILGVALAAV